jgi:hypothetical protein
MVRKIQISALPSAHVYRPPEGYEPTARIAVLFGNGAFGVYELDAAKRLRASAAGVQACRQVGRGASGRAGGRAGRAWGAVLRLGRVQRRGCARLLTAPRWRDPALLQAGRALETAWVPLAWPLGSGAVLATVNEEGALALVNVAQVGGPRLCQRCWRCALHGASRCRQRRLCA